MKIQRFSLVLPLLLPLAACESKPTDSTSAAPAATSAAAATPAPTASAAAAATAAAATPAAFTKLPSKLAKPLGQSTPEDIQKALEAGGIKAKLKKRDRLGKETYDTYNVSWGDGPLWTNIWILVDAPEATVKSKMSTSDSGGRPAANDGKMTLEFDVGQTGIEGGRTEEAKRLREALLGK
jgi:hypothetical protein